jgi:hypothetical protein
MAQPGGHVELVIRTASSVLVGRLAPREAVTILATQTPLARKRARQLLEGDPTQARSYATLLRALDASLAGLPSQGREARDLATVREDVASLAIALEGD